MQASVSNMHTIFDTFIAEAGLAIVSQGFKDSRWDWMTANTREAVACPLGWPMPAKSPQPTYDKAKTVQKTLLYWRYTIHVLHIIQLYEQLRIKKATSDEMALALGQYVKRWQRWVAAGLQGFAINCSNLRYDERNHISIVLTRGTPASRNTVP